MCNISKNNGGDSTASSTLATWCNKIIQLISFQTNTLIIT